MSFLFQGRISEIPSRRSANKKVYRLLLLIKSRKKLKLKNKKIVSIKRSSSTNQNIQSSWVKMAHRVALSKLTRVDHIFKRRATWTRNQLITTPLITQRRKVCCVQWNILRFHQLVLQERRSLQSSSSLILPPTRLSLKPHATPSGMTTTKTWKSWLSMTRITTTTLWWSSWEPTSILTLKRRAPLRFMAKRPSEKWKRVLSLIRGWSAAMSWFWWTAICPLWTATRPQKTSGSTLSLSILINQSLLESLDTLSLSTSKNASKAEWTKFFQSLLTLTR